MPTTGFYFFYGRSHFFFLNLALNAFRNSELLDPFINIIYMTSNKCSSSKSCSTQTTLQVTTGKNSAPEVVVSACYGAYSVAHVFKYLAPDFVPGNLHDAAL